MEIINTIVSILLTGVVSYMTWFMQHVAKKKTGYRAAVVVLLRNSLKAMHKEYTERGWITLDEYEEYCECYQVYSDMGGNGTGTRMMEDIKKIEIRR